MINIEIAKKKLIDEEATLVLYDGKDFIVSKERGVRPLLALYESKKDCSSYVAADKVIGKGAAFLYVLLHIQNVDTRVISIPAYQVMRENGITVTYQELVDHIINHQKTGYCPVETALRDTDNAVAALPIMKEVLKKLKD